MDGIDLRDLDAPVLAAPGGRGQPGLRPLSADRAGERRLPRPDRRRPSDEFDEAALKRAAAQAGALDFVRALPHGWDTICAPGYHDGTDLSGGQWQRIALARALYAVARGRPGTGARRADCPAGHPGRGGLLQPVPRAHLGPDHDGHLAPVRHGPPGRADRRARGRAASPSSAATTSWSRRAAATRRCSPCRPPGSPRRAISREPTLGRPQAHPRRRCQMEAADPSAAAAGPAVRHGLAGRPAAGHRVRAGRARLVAVHAGLPARLPRHRGRGPRSSARPDRDRPGRHGHRLPRWLGAAAHRRRPQRQDDRPGQPEPRPADRQPDLRGAVPRALRAARLPERDRHAAGTPPDPGRRARADPGHDPLGNPVRRRGRAARPGLAAADRGPAAGRRAGRGRPEGGQGGEALRRRPGRPQAAARRPVLAGLDGRAGPGTAHLRGDRRAAGPARPARRRGQPEGAAGRARRGPVGGGRVDLVRGRLRRRDRGPGPAGRARPRLPRRRGRGGQPAAPRPAAGHRGQHQRRLVRHRGHHRRPAAVARGLRGGLPARSGPGRAGRADRRHPPGARRLHLSGPGLAGAHRHLPHAARPAPPWRWWARTARASRR